MTNLQRLRQFRTLARLGSFARASKELHLSQPALSRSMAALEEELGVHLIDRARGKATVALTAVGYELLGYADDLLVRADELESRISRSRTGRQRELRFGMGSMLASTILERPLTRVIADFPSTLVSVQIESATILNERLLDGAIEFFIAPWSQRTMSRATQQIRFGRRTPKFMVRVGHPLVGTQAVHPGDLAAFTRISSTVWNQLLSFADPPEPDLAATVEVDNLDLLVHLAESSDAILLSSAAISRPSLVALSVAVDLRELSPIIVASARSGMQLSPAATLAIAELKLEYESAAPQADRHDGVDYARNALPRAAIALDA